MLSLSEHEIELETDRSKNYSERLREPAFGGQYFDDCTPERGGAIRWAYTLFEACDGSNWVPLRHCSRNCGFYLPPLPRVKYGVHSCVVGCCWSNKTSSSDDFYSLNSEDTLRLRDCNIIDRSRGFQNWQLEPNATQVNKTLCPEENRHIKTVLCDLEQPPLLHMMDAQEARDMCREDLPLADSYAESVLAAACNEYTGNAKETCASMMSAYTTWAVAGDDMGTVRQANHLWSDALLWPKKSDEIGSVLLRSPQDISPAAFRPPSEWSADLDAKAGCDKYDFEWPSFDHMRALYNVSNWPSYIPGVKEKAGGGYELAASNPENSSIGVSCMLWGPWSLNWNPVTDTRYKYSTETRQDRVPFENNGRRFFGLTRDDSYAAISTPAGRISDG